MRTILFLSLILLAAACKSHDNKGMSQNRFRKTHHGLPLQSYLDVKAYSTDKTGKEGISWFEISPQKEREFRKTKTAFMRSKFLYFDSIGITQEEDHLRLAIDPDEQWFLSSTTYYRMNKVEGFLQKEKNGRLVGPELKIKTKETRDSILHSWNYR